MINWSCIGEGMKEEKEEEEEEGKSLALQMLTV